MKAIRWPRRLSEAARDRAFCTQLKAEQRRARRMARESARVAARMDAELRREIEGGRP